MSFSDDDLKRLKESENALQRSLGIPSLLARLEAAEKVCRESEGVLWNVATTEGTKTNSEMPKWFLLRVNDLEVAHEAWRRAKGAAGK